MTRQKTLLTADQFYEFCCRNDGRYELVDGKVVKLAPANQQHGNIAFNISGSLFVYSRDSGIGRGGVETGYRVQQDPDTVRGPDVSFNLRSRQAGESASAGFVPGAPDIAVEIVSPSNTAAEMERKVGEYLAAGAQRVWIVDPPSRVVVVHRADSAPVNYAGDAVITDEELLPGFSLPLPDIFR